MNWIIDVSQQYCENFRKIEQAECVENLPPGYLLPYFCLNRWTSRRKKCQNKYTPYFFKAETYSNAKMYVC